MTSHQLILTHPGLNKKARKYPDTTAGITHKIVDFLNENGAFATRVASTGSYRVDRQRWVFSTQIKGMPDIQGAYKGKALYVEVKVGRDKLSQCQKIIKDRLENAGAWYFVAKDFESFMKWFEGLCLVSIDNQ
jgi:hypothetical protein